MATRPSSTMNSSDGIVTLGEQDVAAHHAAALAEGGDLGAQILVDLGEELAVRKEVLGHVAAHGTTLARRAGACVDRRRRGRLRRPLRGPEAVRGARRATGPGLGRRGRQRGQRRRGGGAAARSCRGRRRGGATRSESVRRGLEHVPAEATIVCVHDAARPFATAELFRRVVAAVTGGADGAVPGLPLADTVKEVDAAGVVVATPERARLVSVQTPQAFRAEVLRKAHADGRRGDRRCRAGGGDRRAGGGGGRRAREPASSRCPTTSWWPAAE